MNRGYLTAERRKAIRTIILDRYQVLTPNVPAQNRTIAAAAKEQDPEAIIYARWIGSGDVKRGIELLEGNKA